MWKSLKCIFIHGLLHNNYDSLHQATDYNLLPTGSEERGVLGIGSIPVAILTSCQDMKITIV